MSSDAFVLIVSDVPIDIYNNFVYTQSMIQQYNRLRLHMMSLQWRKYVLREPSILSKQRASYTISYMLNRDGEEKRARKIFSLDSVEILEDYGMIVIKGKSAYTGNLRMHAIEKPSQHPMYDELNLEA